MQKSSRVRFSGGSKCNSIAVCLGSYFAQCQDTGGLWIVLLSFLILSAASSCWCIVKIAAGGKSSGSGKSQGDLVRIVFWPIFLDEQLVPRRSWALSSRGTEGALLSRPPGNEMCVRCKAFRGEGAAVGLWWARGKANQSPESGRGRWQQLSREEGAQVYPLWHLLAWLKGCPIAVL